MVGSGERGDYNGANRRQEKSVARRDKGGKSSWYHVFIGLRLVRGLSQQPSDFTSDSRIQRPIASSANLIRDRRSEPCSRPAYEFLLKCFYCPFVPLRRLHRVTRRAISIFSPVLFSFLRSFASYDVAFPTEDTRAGNRERYALACESNTSLPKLWVITRWFGL